MNLTKTCRLCGECKPLEEFVPNKNSKRGRENRCKPCSVKQNQEYAKTLGPDAKRDYDLQRYYGISLEDYNRMYEDQGGVCAICRLPPYKGQVRLFVDHNHETGTVRGLLCSECNFGIGKFRDDIRLLQEAVTYLEERDG